MREEKNLLLDEIKEKIDNSKAFIVTKSDKMTPLEAWDFRKTLSKNEAEYEVVKKRILLKALNTSGYKYDLKQLEGHIAVVFISGDPITTTKIVFEFAKQTNKLQVIRGELEEGTYSQSEMEELSKIPPKDELRAQFVGLLEAPMAQTVTVLDSMLTSIIHLIEEKKKLEEKK